MGIFQRLFGRTEPVTEPAAEQPAPTQEPGTTPTPQPGPTSAPGPGPVMDADELAHYEQSLRERAEAEFLTTTHPLEWHDGLATDLASEGFPLERARQILRETWDQRVRLATEHAEQDQSAAVRRAFAALTRDGVLALENFGFDNNEGHDLATEEARAAGAHGYVFFHAQDAARLIPAPGTLYLRFAAARYESTTAAGKYAEDEAVGREVAAALQVQGLSPTWDGAGGSAMELRELHWFARPGREKDSAAE